MISKTIQTWQMTEPGKLVRTEIPTPALGPGEALVEIRGCGVCHTDLSYFYMGVPTIQKPPLTLGHEISGVVVACDEPLMIQEREFLAALASAVTWSIDGNVLDMHRADGERAIWAVSE